MCREGGDLKHYDRIVSLRDRALLVKCNYRVFPNNLEAEHPQRLCWHVVGGFTAVSASGLLFQLESVMSRSFDTSAACSIWARSQLCTDLDFTGPGSLSKAGANIKSTAMCGR